MGEKGKGQNPDHMIASLIGEDQRTGVCLALENYESSISDSTLLNACLYLTGHSTTYALVDKYLDRLAKAYPVHAASLKAFLLIRDVTHSQMAERCRSALSVVKSARKADKENPIHVYNIAYLYARLHQRPRALKWAKKATLMPKPPASSLLLVLRILRASCQTEAAMALAGAADYILGACDRDVLIESMFVAAEKGDKENTKAMFAKLQEKYGEDPVAMNASVIVNLMVKDITSAQECLEKWAAKDGQSAEFMYCYSQLCMAAKDLGEALAGLSAACELKPMDGTYQAALAMLLFKAEIKDRAVERARAAVMYDPESLHAQLALANVSMDQNEANEALERAMELRRDAVDLTNMGILLTRP